MTRLFVYGSLLFGEENHAVLAGARLLGEARTEARFSLIDLGQYPGLVEGGSTAVEGEIYAIDAATLPELDAFEGHPHVYRRTPIALQDGTSAEAYVLQQEHAAGRPAIPSGSWRAHCVD